MFAPVAVLEGGAALSGEPPADDWWWLFDPLGDAWWDPADTGVEPDVEVDPRLEALLGAPGREHDARAWMPLPAAASREGAPTGGSPAPAPLARPLALAAAGISAVNSTPRWPIARGRGSPACSPFHTRTGHDEPRHIAEHNAESHAG